MERQFFLFVKFVLTSLSLTFYTLKNKFCIIKDNPFNKVTILCKTGITVFIFKSFTCIGHNIVLCYRVLWLRKVNSNIRDVWYQQFNIIVKSKFVMADLLVLFFFFLIGIKSNIPVDIICTCTIRASIWPLTFWVKSTLSKSQDINI